MRQANVELIGGKLFSNNFELRAIGKRPREGGSNVYGRQVADGGRLVRKIEIQRAKVRIEVGRNVAPKNVRGLFERVLRLNDTDAARGDLRLRAINVQGR